MRLTNNRILKTALWGMLLVFLTVFGGFYYYWDAASPQTTCASCHEIENSSNMWAQSGHRNLHCKECHGTALSNGLHSLKEKGMMVVDHFIGKETHGVRFHEEQVLEMMENCRRCHGMEYAKWMSGGHSATYASIFLNEKHNASEQLHADCLRCHGMFYGGTIEELVSPLNTKGPWRLIESEKASEPVIPCLVCHKVHREGSPAVRADYSNPNAIFYDRTSALSKGLYYDRYEKTHVELSNLPSPLIMSGDRKVDVSDDPLQRICMQCHAPNAFHQAGTGDDRTPRGVHEGIGCPVCHEGHSNDAKQSCLKCHPAISNCQRDVTKMKTTYAERNSPHDVHFVECIDCHPKGVPVRRVPGAQKK